MKHIVTNEALDLIFRNARTHNAWLNSPVDDGVLRQVYDLAKMGNRSAQSIHYTTEAFRRAFFDRAEFMGDPDFSKIPVAQLIDKKYGTAWRDSIDATHASPSQELKRPEIFVGTLTEKLLTYALGRGVEYYDGPAVREVVRTARAADYRFSELIAAIVSSTPFQMRNSP